MALLARFSVAGIIATVRGETPEQQEARARVAAAEKACKAAEEEAIHATSELNIRIRDMFNAPGGVEELNDMLGSFGASGGKRTDSGGS